MHAGGPNLSLFKVSLTVGVRVVNKIVKPHGPRRAKATRIGTARQERCQPHAPWIRPQKFDKLQTQIQGDSHQQEPGNPSHDQPRAGIFIDGFGHCTPQ